MYNIKGNGLWIEWILAVRVKYAGDKWKDSFKAQKGITRVKLCIGLATRLNWSKECLNHLLIAIVPRILPQVTVKLVLELVIQYVIQSHKCSLRMYSTKYSWPCSIIFEVPNSANHTLDLAHKHSVIQSIAKDINSFYHFLSLAWLLIHISTHDFIT